MPLDAKDLLENKMFLYYLSGVGRGLDPGGVGDVLGGINQQQIASENQANTNRRYLQMLGNMLSGGAKITMDKDNVNIKAPTSLISPNSDKQSGVGNLSVPTPSGIPTSIPRDFFNPSEGLPSISSADVVGLTPQDVSRALSGALDVQSLMEQKASDIADRILKSQQIETQGRLAEAQINKLEAETGELTPSVTIPGTDINLTRKQFIDWYKTASKDERTAAVKNYEYAVSKGFTGSFEQYQDNTRTSNQKDYRAAVNSGYDGSFNEWLLQMRRAGATRISLGEKVEQAERLADVKSKKFFTDPKGLANDVEDYIASDEVQNELLQFEPGSRDREIATVRRREEYITGKITAAGGQIKDAKLDGRTFIWTVEWPDGSTSEVRYAN